MKHHHHKKHRQSDTIEPVPVQFEFTDSKAAQVHLAGSFNQWEPTSESLHASGAGRWSGEIRLAPGTYEYCFVVDGTWVPDPKAEENIANPFGGRNSVLKVVASNSGKPGRNGNQHE